MSSSAALAASDASWARARFRILGVREVVGDRAGVHLLDAAWKELTSPVRSGAPVSRNGAPRGNKGSEVARHYLALWVDDIDNAAAWVAAYCPAFVVGHISRTADGALACSLHRINQRASDGPGDGLRIELLQSFECVARAIDTSPYCH